VTVKFSSLKADVDRETKGDWVPSPDFPGVELFVSSLHLPAYQTELALTEQRLARQAKGQPVSPKARVPAIGKLLHKHILHGWRGFDVEFSKEAAWEMMSVYEGRDFIAGVQNCAALISLRNYDVDEDAAKNSERPSATD
jgi:hypothetical protein